MKNLKPIVWILVTAVTLSCNYKERKIDTYDNIKKDLKGVELERVTPHASPEEFEREVNNGGLQSIFL